jgi:hypothetical protein
MKLFPRDRLIEENDHATSGIAGTLDEESR